MFIISLIAFGCARYGTPGGGPDDTTPPEVLWTLSDANYQTQFNKTEIRLEFNEWITVSNPLKEIVISPPLAKPFQVTTKGKAVIFEFPVGELLKEDVTYQINFGNAIKDFSAGNVKNQVFVFSTGDIIDSLEIGGRVVDELTGKPVKDVTVMVYDDMGDSVIYLQKPFYFAKTDKDGNFQIRNMRSDTFQIYALLDNNVSYTYDLPGEQVAYFDSLIYTSDTTNMNIELQLFDEEEDLRLVDYRHDRMGLYKIKYDRTPYNYKLSTSKEEIEGFSEILRDTLYFYHNGTAQDSFDIYIDFGLRTDTLVHKKSRKAASSVPISYFDPRKKSLQFHVRDSLVIDLNKPLVSIDTSKVELADTTGIKPITSATVDVRKLVLKFDGSANTSYSLKILPEALKDLYGYTNTDTLELNIKTHDPSKFGRIGIRVDSLSSGSYIAQLLSNNSIIRETIIDSSYLEFNKMQGGSYQLKIIEDLNNDGRWSPGNLYERSRSERQGTLNLEELKEGWDLELSVNIKTLLDGA